MDLRTLTSRLKNLFSKPADPRKTSVNSFFNINTSGIYISPEVALTSSAFWACVDVISKSLASSNWNIYKQLRNGDHDALYDDGLNYYLNLRSNKEMSALSFKRALLIASLAWGNGYAEIQRTASRTIAGIWPIHPARVCIKRDDSGNIYYEVKNDDGTLVNIAQEDMLHIKGPSILGFVGENISLKASGAIALYIAQERFAQSYFGNNAQFGGIVEVPGKLDDATFNRLKEQFNKKHKGSDKAFSVGFIEGGMKWHEVNVNADDAQIIEGRNQQIEEICRFFGVPPHKIQHLIRSTFNNIEHLGIEFVREALRPWAQEIQQEFTYKLFPDRSGKFIIVDLEWALQGDFLSRAQGYQIMRNIGAYSVNDILKMERRNTIGKEGDIRIVNGAAIKLEDVGTNYAGTEQPKQMPESQGDATRNSFVSWFESTFNRLNKRYVSRVEYLKINAKNYDKEFSEFIKQFNSYVKEELKQPCLSLSKLKTSDFDCIDRACKSMLEVTNGKNSFEAAKEFVYSIL